MLHDYSSANVREAADGVTEWDVQRVVYVKERDGDLGMWQVSHLANGWTTQHPLEPTNDPADPSPGRSDVATRCSGLRTCLLYRANEPGANWIATFPSQTTVQSITVSSIVSRRTGPSRTNRGSRVDPQAARSGCAFACS